MNSYLSRLFFLLISLFPLTQNYLYSQENSNNILLRESLSSFSPSKNVASNDKTFYIMQSVNLNSVIGNFSNEKNQYIQGFLNPFFRFTDTEISNEIKLSVYPNPFKDGFNIQFKETINTKVKIEIFDLLNRLVYSKEYEPNQLINVNVNTLSISNYILFIYANSKIHQKNIISNN